MGVGCVGLADLGRESKKFFLLTLLNIDRLITVFSDSAGCVQGSSRGEKGQLLLVVLS